MKNDARRNNSIKHTTTEFQSEWLELFYLFVPFSDFLGHMSLVSKARSKVPDSNGLMCVWKQDCEQHLYEGECNRGRGNQEPQSRVPPTITTKASPIKFTDKCHFSHMSMC